MGIAAALLQEACPASLLGISHGPTDTQKPRPHHVARALLSVHPLLNPAPSPNHCLLPHCLLLQAASRGIAAVIIFINVAVLTLYVAILAMSVPAVQRVVARVLPGCKHAHNAKADRLDVEAPPAASMAGKGYSGSGSGSDVHTPPATDVPGSYDDGAAGGPDSSGYVGMPGGRGTQPATPVYGHDLEADVVSITLDGKS